MSEALSFDDVTLIPQFSDIESRSAPDTYVNLAGMVLNTPIVSANMDTVTEAEMATAMAECGARGAMHRFMSVKNNCYQFYVATQLKHSYPFVTVGVKDWFERGSELYKWGARHFIIDIAHGHSSLMKQAIAGLKNECPEAKIIAGNVATGDAVFDLASWGADVVKVGIGGGSICKTRVVTGHGVPMFSCLLECCRAADLAGVQVIADGGIRSSGDIIKALVAGADAVMIGSLLAGTDETPGKKTFSLSKMRYVKSYRGMASAEAQDDRGWGSNVVKVAPEGVATTIDCKGSAKKIVHELTMGLKSGMAYCNARTLSEIPAKAKWIRQTHAAYIEGTPHILRRA